MKTQLLLILSSLSSTASGYTAPQQPNTAKISHRRAFLSKIAGATIAATSGATLFSPNGASAAGLDDNLQNVYFGAGETKFLLFFLPPSVARYFFLLMYTERPNKSQ